MKYILSKLNRNSNGIFSYQFNVEGAVIKVFIVDMIVENLVQATNLLDGKKKNIFLVHGDATNLIFDDSAFDGYWSVQTLHCLRFG